MILTKYSSSPDQDNIDEKRRRAAAAAVGVHRAINQIRKRSIAHNPCVSVWTRPNWVVEGRIIMTSRWPYW